jgi:DNA-binding transcriptional ArsR family regulator
MPKYDGSLDRMFHALGDGSRRAMVERLARGPASVSELARPFDMSLPTIVQHLGVLETAGIVTSTKVGRVRTCQLATGALTPAAEWISNQRPLAERRLDRLGTLLTNRTNEESPT